MKNKKIIISVIFALISVSMLSACTYKFKFKTDEIAEIKIYHMMDELLILPKEKWQEAIDGLNELNFKSYFGDVKAQSSHNIIITFKNKSSIKVNAYRIKKAGIIKRYMCDEKAFTNLIETLLAD